MNCEILSELSLCLYTFKLALLRQQDWSDGRLAAPDYSIFLWISAKKQDLGFSSSPGDSGGAADDVISDQLFVSQAIDLRVLEARTLKGGYCHIHAS